MKKLIVIAMASMSGIMATPILADTNNTMINVVNGAMNDCVDESCHQVTMFFSTSSWKTEWNGPSAGEDVICPVPIPWGMTYRLTVDMEGADHTRNDGCTFSLTGREATAYRVLVTSIPGTHLLPRDYIHCQVTKLPFVK